MNDNEIIKALECCMTIEGNSCDGCPIEKGCISDEGVNILHKHALDIINRQKAEISEKDEVIKAQADKIFLYEKVLEDKTAEIEKLTVNKNAYGLGMQRLAEQLKTAKSEAIKEFERKIKAHAYYIDTPKEHRVVDEDDIDAVLKEMTEQSTGYGSSKTER